MAWMTRKQVRSQPVQSHSEQQLQKLLSAFDRRMNRLNDDYLRRMGEHIRDIGTLWPSDVHRLQQIRRMNKNLRQLERRIAAAAGMGADDIAALFERVAQDDARMAAKILGVPDTVNVMDNLPLRRILQAQARETANRMRNLSNTTVVSSYYRKAIDEACTAVQSGVEDYNTAIRRVIREAGAHGLRVREDGTRAVDYESGWSRRLDSAARMNVLDGMRHLNQSIMEEVGRQFGADGVEIDAHMLCAEDHLPYQGQQFSNEEFEQIQDSLDRPFGEWNCRHSWHPIMLGISPPAWTPEQLEQMRRFSTEPVTVDGRTKTRYKWSQEMRRIETAVRQQKDTANLARVTGDDVLRRRCQGNILELNRYYKELSEKAGLQPEFQRTYVAGFRDISEKVLQNTQNRGILYVDAKGMRNSNPLSEDQKRAAFEFAMSLGVPEEKLLYSDYQQTAYSEEYDCVFIGTDVYPPEKPGERPVTRLSYKAVLGHEITGHMQTCHAKTQKMKDSPEDEAQASLRAARLTPGLSNEERVLLELDAIDRLERAGLRIDDCIGSFDLRLH